jgi:RNA polymerase sigma-70 factor (ECF subfamily)
MIGGGVVDDGWASKQFSGSGKWKNGPDEWESDTPETGVERAEFWDTLNGCADKLPPRLRDVFVLWHLDERESEDVCQAMKVTPTNLWVMLHRARLRLWRCLTRNWYGVDRDDRNERRGNP